MKFISVIIPTYNRSNTLIRALESVLNQSYVHFEVIIVDDGSTDGTENTLAPYTRDGRVLFIQQEHGGVSSARNTGISKARGEYIALLDSDDYWLPGKLERQVEYVLENAWEIVQCEEIWIRNGRRVNPKKKHRKPAGWIFEPSLQLCCISPSCVLFSRKFWERCGPFDESLSACEDYDLWLRGTIKYPVGLVPEALTVKTGGHSGQLSRSITGLDLYRIMSLRRLIQENDLTAEKREKALNMLMHKSEVYAAGCINRGRVYEAFRIRELAGETGSS